jgi:hypothetical protein
MDAMAGNRTKCRKGRFLKNDDREHLTAIRAILGLSITCYGANILDQHKQVPAIGD